MPDPFISAEALSELVAAQRRVRIIDTRFTLSDPAAGRREYERAHIPGAAYVSWLDDISDPDDPVAGQLAPPHIFEQTMHRLGIGSDDLVVPYDDNAIFTGARLAWCLRSNGHDRVRVLDGGFPAWLALGLGVESGSAEPGDGDSTFSAAPHPELRASKRDVLDALERDGVMVVDCRMDETWNSARAHIPGARRLPAPSLVDPSTQRFVSVDEVRRRAAEVGLEPSSDVILYCGGGVSASLAFLALEQAGFERLRVYDGSWGEWGEDPSTPKAAHDPGADRSVGRQTGGAAAW